MHFFFTIQKSINFFIKKNVIFSFDFFNLLQFSLSRIFLPFYTMTADQNQITKQCFINIFTNILLKFVHVIKNGGIYNDLHVSLTLGLIAVRLLI